MASAQRDDVVVTLPTRPLRADAQRNFDRLLATAAAAFAKTGPDTSLERIARDAGVGIGTLYRHFPTRETLMAAVVRDTFQQLQQRATDGLTADDPMAALEDWMRAYFAFAKTKRGLLAGVVILKESDGEFGSICDRMFSALDALVARGQVAGVIREGTGGRDVQMLAGSIGYTAENAPDPEIPERLLEIALDGLRVQSTKATV